MIAQFKTALIQFSFLTTLGVFAACGSSECDDGADNDQDGLVDSQDPACAAGKDNEADDPSTPACSDGVDNDGDGKVDLDDGGCENADDTDENDVPQSACSDGVDNDGDGLMDFPNDPGCASALENSEEDTCGVEGGACPACANGLDDDADGSMDFPNDDGCTSASDEDEVAIPPSACGSQVRVLPLNVNQVVTGTTAGPNFPNELRGPCGDGGTGSEVAYFFEIDVAAAVVVTTQFDETEADTFVYLRSSCREDADASWCNDDVGNSASEFSISRLEAGGYYVIVDSHAGTDALPFSLEVRIFTAAGDSCDANDPANSRCVDGYVCRSLTAGAATTCELPACMDGMDFDGDSLNDYPDDPGCETPEDNTEEDDCPSGPNCPECSDDVDNDGDGLIDYGVDTLGCEAASDDLETDDCVADVPVGVVTAVGVSGTTPATVPVDPIGGSCSTASSGASESVFAYTPSSNIKSVTFQTDSTAGSALVLHVRENMCSDAASEVGCDVSFSTPEQVTVSPVNPASIYFVVVDGASSFSSGTSNQFDLTLTGTIVDGGTCDPASTQFMCDEAIGYVCGAANTCVLSECADGTDNDGDGLADDLDPGCISLSDNDEAPDPSPLPQCADGIDNDNNGSIDFPADTGCSRASDDTEIACGDMDALVDITTPAITGDTSTATNDSVPSCNPPNSSPDIAHSITFPGTLASLTVDTNGSAFDTVLSSRKDDCLIGTPEVCDDDGGTDTQSQVSLTNAVAGQYFFTVDGFGGTNSGPYTLNISGVVAPGQACDMAQVTAGIVACSTGETCTAGVCQ